MADAALEEIRAARQELEAVIDEIHAVPGFEGFLAPPTFEDVARAAVGTPLVYLAAAKPGGVGLVVRGADVHPVELPDLVADELRERLEAHLAAYSACRTNPQASNAAWNASLDDICAWLWTAAMAPVVERLEGLSEVVLVAGGLLGLLPLHAAWVEDPATATGRRYVLDDLTVSYAPNARSLTAARALAQEITGRRLLAVADPQPVAGARLESASLEAAVAAAALRDAPTVIAGGRATSRAFMSRASSVDVLHLACHGFADLRVPLDGGLKLAGNRTVSLRDILTLRLRVRLAILSACETSLPGSSLPDEVIALPTGLLQAGVAAVVGSMWVVPDRATAMLMSDFYRRWGWGQDDPATALRDAQRWLRDSTNDEKIRAWEDALTQEAGWLPRPVGEAFVRALAYLEPDERRYAAIDAWGAFTHVGA